ncbi:MAG: lipopolysaccharide heptosyltransferase II [Candidatus Omnitrophota bacterium]
MQKILVVSTNWFGDALFLFPLLAVLKENFPGSFLAVLSVPRIKGVFQSNPYVDKIIIYDEKGKQGNLISRLAFIFKLRRQEFDKAFILKPSLSRSLILKFAGIKQIIGFDNPKSNWLLRVRVPQPEKPLHKIDYFLTILEYLGLKVSKRRYEFSPSDKDRDYINSLFSREKIALNLPLIVINPGGNWLPKRWLPDKFAELIKRIKDKFPANIVITGAGKDRPLADGIIKKSGKDVYNFAGETSLGQIGALMERADIVISADSGPMHIAAAVGKKVIALFGPTSAQITGPYPPENHIIIQKDTGCKIPCYDSNCCDYLCMKAISVEEVIEKVQELIKS